MMMIETFFLPRNNAVIMNDTDQTININLSIIKNYDCMILILLANWISFPVTDIFQPINQRL